jgi:transcriptional regulator with XRE-family HTH domain
MNTVDFPERLATLRHKQGLTQTTLANQVGIHVSQIRRYEQGTAQPTLDVIRRLTLALNTNADQLIFDPNEHTPNDWQLRLQAITHLDPDEQNTIRTVIDGILIRHQARKLAS